MQSLGSPAGALETEPRAGRPAGARRKREPYLVAARSVWAADSEQPSLFPPDIPPGRRGNDPELFLAPAVHLPSSLSR